MYIFMVAVFVVVSSCSGGGSSGNNGSQDSNITDNSPDEAKVIALSGALAAYLSLNNALGIGVNIIASKWQGGSQAGNNEAINDDYSPGYFGSEDDLITGSFSWSVNKAYSEAVTEAALTVTNLVSESTLVSYPGNQNISGAAITFGDSDYVVNVTTSGNNGLRDTFSGTVTLNLLVDPPAAVSTNNISASSNVTSLSVSVTSPSEADGVVSFSSVPLTGSVEDDDLKLSSSAMRSTVIYNGTTYTCETNTSFLPPKESKGRPMGLFTITSAACSGS